MYKIISTREVYEKDSLEDAVVLAKALLENGLEEINNFWVDIRDEEGDLIDWSE